MLRFVEIKMDLLCISPKSVIPYPREQNVGVRYMQHIGIYAWKQAIGFL
jgi:CMP-2-keto-3-deoxyoctulosonic acid synthetase